MSGGMTRSHPGTLEARTPRKTLLLIGLTGMLWLSPAAAQQPAVPAPSIPPTRTRAVDPIAKAYFELGKALFNAGEWKLAGENLTKSLQRSPNVGEVHLYLGAALIQTRSYKAAEESLRSALNDSDFTRRQRAYSLLGSLYMEQGEPKKAEAETRRAYDLDPKNPMYANNLAYALARQSSNLDDALRLINQSLSTAPEEDPARGYYLDTRAAILMLLNRYTDAEKDATESIKIGEKFQKELLPDRRYQLGEIYLKSNRTELAKREFQKALELNRDHKAAAEALKRIP
jgi:tetratricopeptide (TPR) repeat protein